MEIIIKSSKGDYSYKGKGMFGVIQDGEGCYILCLYDGMTRKEAFAIDIALTELQKIYRKELIKDFLDDELIKRIVEEIHEKQSKMAKEENGNDNEESTKEGSEGKED